MKVKSSERIKLKKWFGFDSCCCARFSLRLFVWTFTANNCVTKCIFFYKKNSTEGCWLMFAQNPGFVIQKLFGMHLPVPGHGDMLGKDSAAAPDLLPLKELALPLPHTGGSSCERRNAGGCCTQLAQTATPRPKERRGTAYTLHTCKGERWVYILTWKVLSEVRESRMRWSRAMKWWFSIRDILAPWGICQCLEIRHKWQRTRCWLLAGEVQWFCLHPIMHMAAPMLYITFSWETSVYSSPDTTPKTNQRNGPTWVSHYWGYLQEDSKTATSQESLPQHGQGLQTVASLTFLVLLPQPPESWN